MLEADPYMGRPSSPPAVPFSLRIRQVREKTKGKVGLVPIRGHTMINDDPSVL
jgi:hypothetical protein